MDTLSNRLTLHHVPCGIEHPYEQEPFERFPRRPVAGQPVSLGVTATGDPEALWAEWRTDGSTGVHRAEGTWRAEEGTPRAGRVDLPAFSAGQRVSYRLFARVAGEILVTDEHTFDIPGWVALDTVSGWMITPEEVRIEYRAAGLDWVAALSLTAREPGELVTAWSFGVSASLPENRPADGGLRAVLDGLEVSLQPVSGLLEIAGPDRSPLIRQVEPPAVLVDPSGKLLRFRQAFASPQDEAFYGFGERFNAWDQRGNTLDMCVFDQYTAQGKRTYIPIPFFVSSRGYGCFHDSSYHAVYDLAAADPERWAVEVELGQPAGVKAHWFVKATPWEIVRAFTGRIGQPALPPDWVFGLWMSSNDWNSQAMVQEQFDRTHQLEIPVTVLVIEAWSDEATFFIWNDAQYLPKPADQAWRLADFTYPADGRWPDPAGMIDRLHAAGTRLVLWQIPVQKGKLEPELGENRQHAIDEAHMISKGYCVLDEDGQPYRVRSPWFRDSLVIDFTNSQATEWWMSRRGYLLDELGVDGFKTDGGEHLWGKALRFSDRRSSAELWNQYPRLYQQAYSDFANQHRPGQVTLFSRAGHTGAGSAPCHWAGDERSTWEAFRATILAGLSAGVSGIPFWGWDMAGFAGEIPTAELYLRAAAMAVFCPIMQYHSDFNARRIPSRDRTPWNIQERTGDERVIPVFRQLANLRMNLLPYITSEARWASQNGLPLMRALTLEYPHDPACREYPYQYLFGRSLLVAPVVEPGRSLQEIYLPEGHWYDLWCGKAYSGQQVIAVDVPIDRIPVFVKAGTMLPLNLDETLGLGSPVGNAIDRYQHLALRIYPGQGEESQVWQDHVSGQSYRLEWCLRPEQNQLAVTLPEMAPAPAVLFPGSDARVVVTTRPDPRQSSGPNKQ